jgi:hypothetical protein
MCYEVERAREEVVVVYFIAFSHHLVGVSRMKKISRNPVPLPKFELCTFIIAVRRVAA